VEESHRLVDHGEREVIFPKLTYSRQMWAESAALTDNTRFMSSSTPLKLSFVSLRKGMLLSEERCPVLIRFFRYKQMVLTHTRLSQHHERVYMAGQTPSAPRMHMRCLATIWRFQDLSPNSLVVFQMYFSLYNFAALPSADTACPAAREILISNAI